MKKKLILCLLTALLVLLCGAARAEERTLVAENDRLSLYLTDDLCGFEVLDHETGMTWSSSMNDPAFDGKLAGLNEKKASSLLTVNVTNLEKGAGSITNAVLRNDKALEASYTPIEGGARIHYDLVTTQIAVDVEVVLDGDTVLVRVPYEGLSAYGDFSIVSIDLMPFLCSGSDNAEGFLFYPDGCGAVLDFQDDAHFRENTQLFTVYGNLEKLPGLLDFFDQEEPTVMMPVYGVSIGGQGMLAVIEEGAETARISVNSSSKILALNYVFANLLYRRGFDDLRVTTRQIKTYDKKAMETDYALRLLFLPDGQSSYSDMAVAYRTYLLEKQGLERRMGDEGVVIDLFMSAPEDGLLFDVQRTVTTLEQAGEMLDNLQAAGVDRALISLKGWAKGGYGSTPDRLPVEGAVGSNRELTALMDKAEAMGITLTLTANLLEADRDSGGYSRRNDVTYLSNYAILTDADEELFVLSPDVIYRKFTELRTAAEKLGVNGLRLERLGQFVGYNYNSGRACSSAECLSYYRRLLTEAREAFGHVSVEGGAVWAAPLVDLMTDVPCEDSGFQFTTRSVPFYQMVMHGVRDYTGTPGNLTSDLQREALRWVEMGYLPYFELTWGSTEALMYTSYQSLFTAQYTAWLDEVVKLETAYTEGDLAQLRDALMLRHERIGTELVRVTYDNGCVVGVNYGETDAQLDGRTIPAMDYAVWKEEQR